MINSCQELLFCSEALIPSSDYALMLPGLSVALLTPLAFFVLGMNGRDNFSFDKKIIMDEVLNVRMYGIMLCVDLAFLFVLPAKGMNLFASFMGLLVFVSTILIYIQGYRWISSDSNGIKDSYRQRLRQKYLEKNGSNVALWKSIVNDDGEHEKNNLYFTAAFVECLKDAEKDNLHNYESLRQLADFYVSNYEYFDQITLPEYESLIEWAFSESGQSMNTMAVISSKRNIAAVLIKDVAKRSKARCSIQNCLLWSAFADCVTRNGGKLPEKQIAWLLKQVLDASEEFGVEVDTVAGDPLWFILKAVPEAGPNDYRLRGFWRFMWDELTHLSKASESRTEKLEYMVRRIFVGIDYRTFLIISMYFVCDLVKYDPDDTRMRVFAFCAQKNQLGYWQDMDIGSDTAVEWLRLSFGGWISIEGMREIITKAESLRSDAEFRADLSRFADRESDIDIRLDRLIDACKDVIEALTRRREG